MTMTVKPGPASLRVAGDPIDGFRSGREARLDMVLAEELAVDPAFATWFVREAGTWQSRADLPEHRHSSATVRVNFREYAEPIPEEAYGETDVDLTLAWLDGLEFPVLIEDKIWAPFQRRQAERYAERARVRGGVSVLVAPAEYIASHMADAVIFDSYVAVQEIIRHLAACAEHSPDDVAANRWRWRARLLREIITRPVRTVVEDDVPTVDFTRFCTEWFEANAPSVITDPRSLRTGGNGWLYFEVPAGLIYKAYGWARRPKAGVDLYLASHGFVGSPEELDSLLDDVGRPAGFERTLDTARIPNVVLRYECPKVIPSEGRPEDSSPRMSDLVDALEACRRASDWLQAHGHRLAGLPA